jgi:hypothetical protein
MENKIINIDGLKVLLWGKTLPNGYDDKVYLADFIFGPNGEVLKDRLGLSFTEIDEMIETYKFCLNQDEPITSITTDKSNSKFLILASRKTK